jgi:putative solute:sodium symporter small subunit
MVRGRRVVDCSVALQKTTRSKSREKIPRRGDTVTYRPAFCVSRSFHCAHPDYSGPLPRGRRKARRTSALAANETGGLVREDQEASVVPRGRLPIVALLFWALFAFVVPSFVQALNLVDVLAFPLGYYMAAQGILIAFVIVGLLSVRWQDRRDARRGAGA